MQPNTCVSTSRSRLVGVLAGAGASMALLALVSWSAGKWQWLALGTGRVPMAPGAALLLLLLNTALLAQLRCPTKLTTRAFGWVAVVVATMLGALALVRSFFGWGSPLEQWLAGTAETAASVPVGQMSPLTGSAFLLLGCALLLQLTPFRDKRPFRWLGVGLALLVCWVSGIVILGYAADMPLFYNRPVIPMALWTAIAFIFTSAAVGLAGGAERMTVALDRLVLGDSSGGGRRPWSGLLVVFGLVAISIVTGGWFFLRDQQSSARAAAQRELKAIGDLKVEQIINWRDERLDDGALISHSDVIASEVQAFLRQPDVPQTRATLLQSLALLQNHIACDHILLFDPEVTLRLALPESSGPPEPEDRAHAESAMRSGAVALTNLYRSSSVGDVHLDLTIPLFPLTPQAGAPPPIVGVLMLQINAARFLYPVLHSWPIPSRTAETFLVQRVGDEVVFLSDLRHHPGAALNLRLPINPQDRLLAATAASVKESVVAGIDHRGVPVVAAVRAVPGTPWFMVAKVDEAEIYEPLYRQTWLALALLGLLLTATALALWLFSQRSDLIAQRQRSALAERVALLLRQANDSILLADENYLILDANQRAVETYGWSLAELQHLKLPDLRSPETRARFAQDIAEVTETGALIDTVHRRKDGTTFPVEASVRRVTMAGQQFVQAIVRDITERKRIELALQHSEERFRTMAETATDAIVTFGPDGRIQFFNHAAQKIFDYSPAEVVGQDVALLLSESFYARHLDTGELTVISKTIEWEGRHKTGHLFPLELSLAVAQTGVGVTFTAIMRDITARKSEERHLAQLVDELQRADRLKSEFVATMSHELRTPLNIIIGYNDLLIDGVFGPVTAEQTDTLQRVGKSASELLGLINSVLDISRLEAGGVPLELKEVALPDLVRNLDQEMRRLHDKPHVILTWDIAPHLPPLRTDPVQLKSVLKNLIDNAMKFTDTGSVTVRIAPCNDGVEMVVADTGIGMTPDTLAVVFEPFQQGDSSSTRRHGGVGLGLYIVRRVIEALRGTIEVHSEVGHGSTFRVWVPGGNQDVAGLRRPPQPPRTDGDRQPPRRQLLTRTPGAVVQRPIRRVVHRGGPLRSAPASPPRGSRG